MRDPHRRTGRNCSRRLQGSNPVCKEITWRRNGCDEASRVKDVVIFSVQAVDRKRCGLRFTTLFNQIRSELASGRNPTLFYFSLGQPQEKSSKREGLVRMRGLEPPRIAPLPPQGSVSTSSTTSALFEIVYEPAYLLAAGSTGSGAAAGVAGTCNT